MEHERTPFAWVGGSVVLQGYGVGRDVHLGFVLDQLDDAARGTERVTELGTTQLARTIEVLDDITVTTRAAELHALRR